MKCVVGATPAITPSLTAVTAKQTVHRALSSRLKSVSEVMKRGKMWLVWWKEYHVENRAGKCLPVENTDALKFATQVSACLAVPPASSPAPPPDMNVVTPVGPPATRAAPVQKRPAPRKRGLPASVVTEAPRCPARRTPTTG